MRKLFIFMMIISLTIWGLISCKPGLLPTEEAGKPKVTLDRVEVQSYFPWADLPARTPMVLGFVFNIENPSGYNVKLENFKFSISFEAAPGTDIEIAMPTYYDQIYFPPTTKNQYRVVSVLDSMTMNLTMLVAQAPKVRALNIKPADLIKRWYSEVGDFKFGIKVKEGQATFSTEKGDVIVSFEGKFPKK